MGNYAFGLADAAYLPRKRDVNLSWFLYISDFLVIIFGFIGAVWAFQNRLTLESIELFRYAAVGTLFAIIFFLCNDYRELYKSEALFDIPRQIGGVTLSWWVAWGVLAFTGFALKARADLSRVVTFSVAIIELPVLLGARIAARAIASSLSMSSTSVKNRIALLSVGEMRGTVASLSRDYDVVRELVLTTEAEEKQLFDSVRAFLRALRAANVDTIFVASSFRSLNTVDRIVECLRTSPLPIVLLSEEWVTRAFARPVSLTKAQIGFQLQTPPLTNTEKAIKHGLDTLLAGCAIFLLSPLMLLVAFAVKLDSCGPVFFRQRRQGFDGQDFNIFKFRSMTVLEDGAKIQQARKFDKRVTRVGRFIRATSLDELPQLFNVLRGEMSLVGPRPHAIAHDNHYEQLIRDYAIRRHMRPGLTGWAQVNGYRGETPRISDMEARVEHDLWYINNWSLALDIWILFRTAEALFQHRNAY